MTKKQQQHIDPFSSDRTNNNRNKTQLLFVKVFHLPLEPTGTAASTYGEAFGMAVLLNSSHVAWRRNFDLAHELFQQILELENQGSNNNE